MRWDSERMACACGELHIKRQNAENLLPSFPFTPKAKVKGKYGAWLPLFLEYFRQPDPLLEVWGEHMKEKEGVIFVKSSFLAVFNDLLTDFVESNL